MNGCRRIACGVWTPVFSRTNGRRCPQTGPSLSRSQASAAATSAPGAGAENKPRLKAIDLARKVRQERAKPEPAEAPVSAQQKRVTELKRFSQQLQNVHPNVLAGHLHRSVLYQDEDVVVINKPYGVPLRDTPGVTSISSVLPVLSKMMDGMKIKSDFQLFPSLPLEKEMSGVLLLARREEVVEHIHGLLRDNHVERKYWVITVGTPVPSEGVIDIPIIEREVTGPQRHYKMALSPLFKMNEAGDGLTKVRSHRQAHTALTKYRVLDSMSGCSLVEIQAFTGVKHQMRVHMAYALGCPILGDHKYSHWSKLAPQKLPDRVLGKLRLEQSKIRYLPLHLLARQLTLPGISKAEISVSCPMPKYFTQTLNRLHLSLPEKRD